MSHDALSQVLGLLRMRGSIYFHTHFAPPFSILVPAYRNVARFHLVIRGQCCIQLPDAKETINLSTGDLVVIPHGGSHILADAPGREPVLLEEVVIQSGYHGDGALVYGESSSDSAVQLFCGHFEFDEGVMHPILTSLPRTIHMPNRETMNAQWLEPVIKFVTSEVQSSRAGADAIVLRLTEIIFIQVMRAFVAKAGDAAGGLAGVLDPQLGRALAGIHENPKRDWTVEMLATEAGLSRTVFAQRFSDLIGMPPLAYLTHWRMQLTRRKLLEGTESLTEIAEQVGYQSEAALSRTFKREFDVTPAAFRRAAGRI